MKAYSVDLRIKIVVSVRRGVSNSETGRRFLVACPYWRSVGTSAEWGPTRNGVLRE
jgi:hypothetical protein